MSNYKELLNEVNIYLKAETPLIVIKSSERERIERLLSEIANSNRRDILGFSTTKQVFSLRTLQTIESSNDPIQYAVSYFKKKREGIFALIDINHIENDNMYSRDILNSIYAAKESNSTLIIVTGDTIWNRLSELGLMSILDYPSRSERKELVIEFVNKYKNVYKIDYEDSDFELASSVLRGFSETQILNVLSSNMILNKGLFKKDIFALGSQKKKIYGFIPNVELIDLDEEICVNGLDNMKKRLEEKKKIFFAEDQLLKKYSLNYPKGVLLTGVPGCGKSLTAKMIAKTWNLPLYKFDLGTIFNKYVGESEKQMKEALDFIDHMAPCIVWVDEIEKSLSSNNDSNDTGKRIVGQFLFWLQESKSRVFLIATANDITNLPPELFRKGRFSEIFFIDLPNEYERRCTLLSYINRCIHYELNENELNELVKLTYGFSYSDIESAIKEVATKFIINRDYVINFNDIKYSINNTISYLKNSPEIVEKCREWGRERATFASLERR